MRSLTETGRLAFVVLLCTIASAVSQSTPTLIGSGTWYFTEHSLHNDGPGKPGQMGMHNKGMGAILRATGEGLTGIYTSRLTNDNQAPVIRCHKGRGEIGNQATVKRNDLIGCTMNFSMTINPSGAQTLGVQLSSRVIDPNPSENSFHSRFCITVAGPAPTKVVDVACFDPVEGISATHLSLAERGRIPPVDHLAPPTHNGMVRVVLDKVKRPQIAISKGGYWFINGTRVN